MIDTVYRSNGVRNHAETRWRPLTRRRLMTALPLRVRMRERNPCLRLRRRTLGWYVRFIAKEVQVGGSGSALGYEPLEEIVKEESPVLVVAAAISPANAKSSRSPRKKELAVISQNTHVPASPPCRLDRL